MKRALVIKIGDENIANAIESGIGVQCIDNKEVAAIRKQCTHLTAVNGVRAAGDKKRWTEVEADLARMYSVRRHGRVYSAILLAWAMFWGGIFEWVEYFQAWNRESE